jgi:hypothetical protein
MVAVVPIAAALAFARLARRMPAAPRAREQQDTG